MFLALAIFAFLAAIVPACLYFRNIVLYQPLPHASSDVPISVLIPARNEEAGIAACVASVLANVHRNFEVIVLDDHSTDGTARIIRELARAEARLRLEGGPALPEGWCGKQHACALLSKFAAHELLIWMDADVRLAPDALVRIAAYMDARQELSLLSGFPRQITGSFVERLLIPLIHFVLLGFLPIQRMRSSRSSAYGAGCGQLFIARKAAYERCGGHSAIAASLHDGVKLPRAFRHSGEMTDLFDATDLASCRMYTTSTQTLAGLAKNATEGLGEPRAIWFWTVILLCGQVLPLLLSGLDRRIGWGVWGLCCLSTLASLSMRLAAAIHFKQSILSIVFHPLGIMLLLVIQWYALIRRLLGKPAQWKGRRYPQRSSDIPI